MEPAYESTHHDPEEHRHPDYGENAKTRSFSESEKETWDPLCQEVKTLASWGSEIHDAIIPQDKPHFLTFFWSY